MAGPGTISRGRFVKSSIVAAVGFVAAGRDLIAARSARAVTISGCEFVDCEPEGTICWDGTLYGVEYCYDSFDFYFCYESWWPLGCC